MGVLAARVSLLGLAIFLLTSCLYSGATSLLAFANVASEVKYGEKMFSVSARSGKYRELRMGDITLNTDCNVFVLVDKYNPTLEQVANRDSRDGQLIISIGFERVPSDFSVIGQPQIIQNGKIYQIEKAYLSDFAPPEILRLNTNLVENKLELALPIKVDQAALIDFQKKYQTRRRVVLKLIFADTPKITRFSLQGLKMNTSMDGLHNIEILYQPVQTNL